MRISDSFVDLECGRIVSDNEIEEVGGGGGLNLKRMFDGKRSGVGGASGFRKVGEGVSTSKKNAEIFVGRVWDKVVDMLTKKNVSEEWKKPSFKKPLKPPRPPGTPSLDEADMMLVKEISELVRLKQARKERMRALRKRKLHKGSSSISLYAMIFTILFCFVIIYQGILGSRI